MVPAGYTYAAHSGYAPGSGMFAYQGRHGSAHGGTAVNHTASSMLFMVLNCLEPDCRNVVRITAGHVLMVAVDH